MFWGAIASTAARGLHKSWHLLSNMLASAAAEPKTRDDAVVLATATDQRWRFDVADPQTASRLRGHLTAAIAARSNGHCDLAATELILGELLANVVQHAPGAIDIVFLCDGADYELHVTDRGAGFTSHSQLPENLYSVHGRGMFLVDALAKCVEILPAAGGGSTVRVILPQAV